MYLFFTKSVTKTHFFCYTTSHTMITRQTTDAVEARIARVESLTMSVSSRRAHERWGLKFIGWLEQSHPECITTAPSGSRVLADAVFSSEKIFQRFLMRDENLTYRQVKVIYDTPPSAGMSSDIIIPADWAMDNQTFTLSVRLPPKWREGKNVTIRYVFNQSQSNHRVYRHEKVRHDFI